LEADWSRVFKRAAELDKAVEIDGYSDRQDLSSELLEIARQARCRISLGSDAHSPEQLEFLDFSLAAALRAGIPQDRILNFMKLDDLRRWSRGPSTDAGRQRAVCRMPGLKRKRVSQIISARSGQKI
jgi:histidinol phosphatase-like PHP family hydrolase